LCSHALDGREPPFEHGSAECFNQIQIFPI